MEVASSHYDVKCQMDSLYGMEAPYSVSFQLHRKRLLGLIKAAVESNTLQQRYRNNTCSLCPTEHNSMNC